MCLCNPEWHKFSNDSKYYILLCIWQSAGSTPEILSAQLQWIRTSVMKSVDILHNIWQIVFLLFLSQLVSSILLTKMHQCADLQLTSYIIFISDWIYFDYDQYNNRCTINAIWFGQGQLVQCSDFKSGKNGKNGLFKVRQSAKNPFEFQKESCYCVNKYCL